MTESSASRSPPTPTPRSPADADPRRSPHPPPHDSAAPSPRTSTARSPAPAPAAPAPPPAASAPPPPSVPRPAPRAARSRRACRRRRRGATPRRGSAPTRAAPGITAIRSGAGPGAGSPNLRTSSRHARYASPVVTFCSRIDGISDSSTSPVRSSRSPGSRWWVSASSRCRGTKADGSSAAAEQFGETVEEPVRAGAPRLAPYGVVDAGHPERAGAHRGQAGAPRGAVRGRAERRVAGAAAQRAEDEAQVQGPSGTQVRVRGEAGARCGCLGAGIAT